MPTKQQNPPTQQKQTGNESDSTPTRWEAFIFIPLILLILAWVITKEPMKDRKQQTSENQKTNQDESLVVQTKNFGTFDLYDLKVPEVKNLQKVFVNLKSTNPEVFAEMSQTDDDWTKLNRVLTESGALLSDMRLLAWAIQALDQVSAGLRDMILERICQAIPSLNVCHEMYPSELQQNDVVEEVKHLGDKVYIEDMDISVRGYNVLKYVAGFKTVADVLKRIKDCHDNIDREGGMPINYDWKKLFKLYTNCGGMTVHQIEEAIRDLGPEYQNFMDQNSGPTK